MKRVDIGRKVEQRRNAASHSVRRTAGTTSLRRMSASAEPGPTLGNWSAKKAA